MSYSADVTRGVPCEMDALQESVFGTNSEPLELDLASRVTHVNNLRQAYSTNDQLNQYLVEAAGLAEIPKTLLPLHKDGVFDLKVVSDCSSQAPFYLLQESLTSTANLGNIPLPPKVIEKALDRQRWKVETAYDLVEKCMSYMSRGRADAPKECGLIASAFPAPVLSKEEGAPFLPIWDFTAEEDDKLAVAFIVFNEAGEIGSRFLSIDSEGGDIHLQTGGKAFGKPDKKAYSFLAKPISEDLMKEMESQDPELAKLLKTNGVHAIMLLYNIKGERIKLSPFCGDTSDSSRGIEAVGKGKGSVPQSFKRTKFSGNYENVGALYWKGISVPVEFDPNKDVGSQIQSVRVNVQNALQRCVESLEKFSKPHQE